MEYFEVFCVAVGGGQSFGEGKESHANVATRAGSQ